MAELATAPPPPSLSITLEVATIVLLLAHLILRLPQTA